MSNSRYTLYFSVGAFLLGALVLSLLAIPQKIILGVDPLEIKGFLVPVLFGGVTGLLLGLAYARLQRENRQIKRLYREFEQRDRQYKAYFDSHHAPMILFDAETSQIVDANPAACAFYGYDLDQITKMKISDINTMPREDIANEMELARSQDRQYFNFKHRLAGGELRDVEAYRGSIKYNQRDLFYSVIHDVTVRRRHEAEREELIAGLRDALAEIKTLSGLLPICAECKKIRDDKGYWQQIEEYIGEHSDARFSHSICPDCMAKLYPEVAAKKRS